jgi:hypothetical protein
VAQRWIVRAVLSSLLLLASSPPASAQDKPRYGGELVFVVPGEPPSYDAHREETFALIHPTAPHYDTLLRTIIPHSAKVRGWTITPSHYINQQLDAVWLAQ